MARYDLSPAEYDVTGARIAIAAARFNDAVVSQLLEGVLHTLSRYGLGADATPVVRVPGAFELPLTARWLARGGDMDAVIALGAVIRGDTPHFDYVCAEAARGLRTAATDTDIPVIFGVLTCDDHAQAAARAGGAHGNKGREAALAALEMVTLRRRLGA
ncbi:MAG: 6,7-dimethyl-8-ribityllumazine synthase [Thiotrichales bacterium]|nr:6,7-dimethyl-8-ribityllumazine synthase [Thiotrichales bacterium]MCY4286036.1 6,7-dimethyl-8-ribityllumazine synthase [Thiotrichales bacterium]